MDVTIIEIDENKDGIKDFLSLDEQIFDRCSLENNENKTYFNNFYSKESIYILNYLKGHEIVSSYGLLSNCQGDKINHKCNTDTGSSGSPIILLKNHKVIGVHYGSSNHNFNLNFGTLLLKPIKEFQQIYDSSLIIKNNIDNKQENLLRKINFSKKINEEKNPNNFLKSDNINMYEVEYLMKNGLDISNKKGFSSFEDKQYSRLNSIIQMLTSIKEIIEIINPYTIKEDADNIIQKFNHIYPFTSCFQKAFLELYSKSKKSGVNISLSKMNVFMKFVNKDISKQNDYNYFISILTFLHEELVNFPNEFPGKEPLISFNSPFDELDNSKNIFYSYYENTYKKSIISNLFNWIRREDKYCLRCQITKYSYQSYPSLLIDLDDIDKFLTENKMYLNEKDKKLDLQTCLNIYSVINHITNKNNNETCVICSQNYGFKSTYFIDTSPPYFIIILNRNKAIYCSYKDEFELPKDNNSTYIYKKYKLMGVITKEGTNYSCLIKNSEYKNKGGKIFEHWRKFSDENIRDIKFEKIENVYEKQTIFHPYNARILLFKGINSINSIDNFDY